MTIPEKAIEMISYPINTHYPTIQGEGCLTGTAMILLRMQGCDVACPFCDTMETWRLIHRIDDLSLKTEPTQWAYTTPAQLIAQFRATSPGVKWVLVTGGEPAQYDLAALVDAFHAAGYKAALETSGTETGHVDAGFDWVCVSPKIGMPGGKVIKAQALAVADEIKMVIGSSKQLRQLDQMLEENPILKEGVTICLQPMSQSKKATELAINTCMTRGYRLSVQVHKYLDLA